MKRCKQRKDSVISYVVVVVVFIDFVVIAIVGILIVWALKLLTLSLKKLSTGLSPLFEPRRTRSKYSYVVFTLKTIRLYI